MPHVGRIPSTLEKYRHALSAYLDDITLLNCKSHPSSTFLYRLDDSSLAAADGNAMRGAPIPDTETRILSSYSTVKKQLDLLSSYFSLIHDDLHGDLLLLRTNLNLLPSNTQHLAQQNNQQKQETHANLHSQTHAMAASASTSTPSPSTPTTSLHSFDLRSSPARARQQRSSTQNASLNSPSISNSSSNSSLTLHSPSSKSAAGMDRHLNADLLNTRQTQSIQRVVSVLQKFIKHNAMLVEYIQHSREHVGSFWVHNDCEAKRRLGQLHKLNIDVESIVSTMCIKELIHTKSSSCHSILFHDILGCANTKQFFTRIYFIVSIWYSFFHALHNDDEHAKLCHSSDDDHSDDDAAAEERHTPCNSYLTKLFAMTDFKFLTRAEASASNSTATSPTSSSSRSLTSQSRTQTETETEIAQHSDTQSATAMAVVRTRVPKENRDENRRRYAANQTTRTSSAESDSAYNWTSRSHTTAPSSPSPTPSIASETGGSKSKDDFLLKYLNAQNNYLQSIWYDGIALLEYSLHLLQQQEFRLSCRVAHRCLELFQKQQEDQRRQRHRARQTEHWNQLGQDLYDENELQQQALEHAAVAGGAGSAIGGGGVVAAADPLVGQAAQAQIPGLWYIEMHLANCYHTWGQSNMALYHINRTLEQLGNYHINPDTLTVRLNSRRKFQLLSTHLVKDTRKTLAKQRRERMRHQERSRSHSPKMSLAKPLIDVDCKADDLMVMDEYKGHTPESVRTPEVKDEPAEELKETKEDDTPQPEEMSRSQSFIHKIKMNNRRRRKSTNNMFTKLFDRFSAGMAKRRSGGSDKEESKTMSKSKSAVASVLQISKSSSNSTSRSQQIHSRPANANPSNPNPNSRNQTQTQTRNLSRFFTHDDGLVGSNNTSRCSSASASRSPSASALSTSSQCMSLCNEDSKDDAEFDPESLQLCLEEDLNLTMTNVNIKMSEDSDNELPDDDELEIEFFPNEPDASDSDSSVVPHPNDPMEEIEQEADPMDGAQLITLEALLSMHMTKGRILIEMKLLREALELYTYIIDECEALIQYHALVNPHHIELEREFDQFAQSRASPRQRRRRNRNGSNRSTRHHHNHGAADYDDDGDDGLRAGRMSHPLPNTPFRRLAKNVGLENYYAARGDIYFKFKDLKHALADFSNAIKYGKCKKEKGIYYNLRGVCFHELKQYERALRDYDNAVKSMYGNHVAWNNRAALLVDMGEFDDAIENANKAIKLDPSYGNAYKHRGVAYHLKCEYEEAITDINRCIKLLPNYRPARLALQAIWKDIFECVRVVNADEGVPLDLVKIMVDYTVGNGYEIDEFMVNFTYC